MMLEITALLALIALAWFWLDSLGTREIALKAARELCEAEGKQLLDESIANRQLRLVRDDEGHVRLGRTYVFEYSEYADERRQGRVVMLGRHVELVNAGLRRVH